MIFVEVDACPGSRSVVRVLSDDDVDGADADTLLTTEDTMERSTGYASQPRRERHPIILRLLRHVLFSCKASNLGSVAVFSSKSA